MEKKHIAVLFVVAVAIVGVATFYIYQAMPPAIPAEFKTIDDMLKDLDEYLGFENQTYDYDMGDISGDWG